MSKKYYIIGGVILSLLIILLGLLVFKPKNPNPPTGNIELTWWKTFETSENVQQLIADYEQTHKNVVINYIKKDVGTYEDDLLNAYASNAGPDILSIHNDWLPQDMDKLAPMPANFMSLRKFQDTFVDVAASDFVKDGKIYGLPMNIDVLALYYNQDILGSSGFATPPKTWEQLANEYIPQITKVTKPGNFLRSGISMGTASNVNRAVDIISLLMLQNGTQFYSPDFTSATFDQSKQLTNNTSYNPGANAIDYYTQFSNPANSAYTWNAKSDNSVDAFTQGKLAMMLSYYYMTPQIKDKGPNLNWRVAPVPQTSLDAIKVNFANYWGEAVNKNSKNAAAAWDFLNFITSKEELSKYYSVHKQISSRKDIISEQLGDSEIGVYAEAALTAKSVYKKQADAFESVFSRMIEDVSVRGLTPREAISNASQQISAQLQN